MARQKRNKDLQHNQNNEVPMTDPATLEAIETDIDKARQELERTKLEIEEKKSQLRSMPAREVSEDEMIIVKKQVNMSNSQAALKAKIEKQKAHDSVMVTGRFYNRHSPGKQDEKLTYLKYDTDPVKWYSFNDGQVYTIPRGFVDQINGGTEDDPCYYKPHFNQKSPEQYQDPTKPTSAISNIDTSNKKYAFTPINF